MGRSEDHLDLTYITSDVKQFTYYTYARVFGTQSRRGAKMYIRFSDAAGPSSFPIPILSLMGYE